MVTMVLFITISGASHVPNSNLGNSIQYLNAVVTPKNVCVKTLKTLCVRGYRNVYNAFRASSVQ